MQTGGRAFGEISIKSRFSLFAFDGHVYGEDQSMIEEEVVVTGTRMKSDQYSGISPVISIDSSEIAESGFLNVSDVLRSQVQNTLGSSYEGFNSTSTVDSQMSLRGIGSSRTLVLIDGRRLPGSPKASGASSNLNMIPTEMVERVEIMTDGASAIYGGDASGGVVNIITKKRRFYYPYCFACFCVFARFCLLELLFSI